ncbi:MAG: hypothetical protein MI824_03780 [Hyphomicrobiales bacterium]|nr:hypothetical protein [Hyphomicrobiales bacterium]
MVHLLLCVISPIALIAFLFVGSYVGWRVKKDDSADKPFAIGCLSMAALFIFLVWAFSGACRLF